MLVGSLCLSHSPLMHYVKPAPEVGDRFDAAVERAAKRVAASAPEVVVIFYPDHVNGFFYRLLPPFCVGIEGQSIGDYGTAAGRLDIPDDLANDLARHLLDAGVDTAISHDMRIDHGAVQPLEWLLPHIGTHRVIPIFVNCAAPPLPTFRRARALGRAVGDWARSTNKRVIVVGSGGLSHDPPMASLQNASQEMLTRVVEGSDLSHAQRFKRQSGASAVGRDMAAGGSTLLRACADWDRTLLDAFAVGNLEVLDGVSDAEISGTGGRGGHEVRAWVAALAALREGYECTEIFHEVIDEWITGMAILFATNN